MDDSSERDGDATSARLHAAIAEAIVAGGGWIRFSRFMELALYAPGLGYYSAGATKLGSSPVDGSDFVTAPELTPLFGRALARPVADVLADGGDTIVELGGGSGRLAVDLLGELDRLGRLPRRYLLLDVSADLRDRQRATLAADAPHLAGRVEWIERLPDAIDGVVVGNEVLDALPVELVVRHADGWAVRGVEQTPAGFAFADRALPDDLIDPLRAAGLVGGVGGPWAPGYVTEIHPAAAGLMSSIVERLTYRSVAMWIDYGFPASEYYHPQREGGTLMAHRAHRATTDVLAAVGLCDLTAHVNFTALAAAAATAGGVVLGYASQGTFLIECGIGALVDPSDTRGPGWVRQAAALQTLLSEAEMGELFKIFAVGRAGRARLATLPGFQRRDRRRALD